jgi:hypothetical protein
MQTVYSRLTGKNEHARALKLDKGGTNPRSNLDLCKYELDAV